MAKITIEPMTRIESHGKLTLEFDEAGNPEKAFFSTPVLRGFEAFLVGAPVERTPWLASRICGVCPVSHSVNAAQTIEKAMQVEIPETAKVLRELLVLSQLIDSHALSFVILSLPDIAPKENLHSVVDIKREYPNLFEKGMLLHTLGRKMTSTLGGRNVHPANVRIGGMGVNPLLESELDFEATVKEALTVTQTFLESCKSWLTDKAEFVKTTGSIKSNYMALSENGQVSFVRGKIRTVNYEGTENGLFDPDDYLDYLAEVMEPHTYMKLPYLKPLGQESGTLRVNCLARANVNDGFGTSLADQELKELRDSWGQPLEHSLLSHWARLIETIYACERVSDLLDDPFSKGTETTVDVVPRDGESVGCIEAPRGTLFHHYAVKEGHIAKANLVVATQNNALAVNDALTQTLKLSKENGASDDEIVHNCEMVVRAYDPCISCSTHIVKVKEDAK